MTPPNLMELLFLLPFIWVYPALNPPSVAAGWLQNGTETVVLSQLAPHSPYQSALGVTRTEDIPKTSGGITNVESSNQSPPSTPPPRGNEPSPPNRPPPSFPPHPGITAANVNKSLGKKVGVLFLGIVAFLQVCAVLFLFFKKRQLEATAKHS